MSDRPTDHPYGLRELQLVPPSKGRDVWELQIKLIAFGSGSDAAGIGAPMLPVRVTGAFDHATRDAVKRFQSAVGLPVTGVAGAAVFHELDREAARWPVLVDPMRCPCAAGKNKPPVLCRCTDHDADTGQCTGFGKGRAAGKFLLSGKKLPDGSPLDPDNLDIYDMKEHAGMDKALLWALRGMMRRLPVAQIDIEAGYRCWTDNYHHTDERRWRHRKATFHFGKSVEFSCPACNHAALAPKTPCPTCATMRDDAVKKCGFQLRWQEPDRVTVAGASMDGDTPLTPAIHVSTVRRRGRHDDEFVQTFLDSVKPLDPRKLPGLSYPLDLGAGLDPKLAPTPPFFLNTETRRGGRFPVGASRIWHGGIHLYAAAGAEVRAIADGEVVGCRLNEAETAKAFGSRNFVLLRHTWKDKPFYSLYMHLDNGAASAASTVPWRKKLHLLTKDHAAAVAPCPYFLAGVVNTKNRLIPQAGAAQGLGPGDWAELAAGAAPADPKAALDATAPANSSVIQLASPPNTYVYLKMENLELAQQVPADGALAGKLGGTDVIAVSKPIPVRAGEVIGKIAAAPTDAVAGAEGAFLHLETFAGESLPAPGFVEIDATAAKMADRKAIVAALKGKHLIEALPSDVWLDSDIKTPGADIYQAALRGVVLKAPSAWSLDWKAALKAADVLSFMQDGGRDKLGDDMNEYRWWSGVTGDSRLPASDTVYHYHPIALLMQMALG